MFNMPLLMVILSLVYPIVAPFDIILETLKIFLTAWDTYRTSLDLTVSPTCSFIFTVNLRSHFNFCPFFNVTSILHSSILVMFYSCMWYEMTHHCIPTGLQGLLPCHFTRLVYRMCPVQRVCRRHLLSSSSWTNNQPPYIIFSKVVTFSAEVGFSVIIIFCFLYFHLSINMTLCYHTYHSCCMCPWRTCSCVVSCLQCLVLEPSILDPVSHVSCFCPIISSRTN